MPSSPTGNHPQNRGVETTASPSTLGARGAVEIALDTPLDLLSMAGTGPVYVEAGRMIAADNLRAVARLWDLAFRDAGLGPGDRVVLAARPGIGFLSVLTAALGRRLTLALVPPGSDLDEELGRFDARVAIGEGVSSSAWTPCQAGGPPGHLPRARPSTGVPTPEARLILATSGTTGSPRWVILSEGNLRSVLSGHLPLLGLEGARVLSILPWTHAFGLIIDLLPALLAGAVVVRDPEGGRDPRSMVDLIARERITHLSAVPLAYRRLADHSGDDALLRSLRGGVVGGAPVTPSLAGLLANTRLRVGYGLTEASPGLALGDPGAWPPYTLGRPVGCRVRLNRDGGLQFRGPNACLGFWSGGSLHRLEPDRWVDTGDLVEIHEGGLIYRGRTDDRFKLENGRWIPAGECEARLRCRFPQIDEALVFSPDGTHLALAWSGDRTAPTPDLQRLREALGSPGALLREVARVPEPGWPRTPKGSIDRRAAQDRLVDLIRSPEGDPP